MLSHKFTPDQAKIALGKLKDNNYIASVQNHHISDKYFEDVVETYAKLEAELNDKMPKIVVEATDIMKIPRPENCDLDEIAIGSRMNVVDNKLENVEKKLNEFMANVLSIMTKNTCIDREFPVGQNPTVSITPAEAPTNERNYAAAAARLAPSSSGGNRRNGTISDRVPIVRGRERSNSNSKRKHDDANEDEVNSGGVNNEVPFNEVMPRKQRKVQYGKARVNTKRSDEAVAPYEIFIANTHPLSTKELIKEILIDCAKDDKTRNVELDIIDVKCMTNKDKIPNPRTLCWKVTVPHREREHMLKDESYPEGWAHRRFFPPKQNPLPPPLKPSAKQPRLEENITHGGA